MKNALIWLGLITGGLGLVTLIAWAFIEQEAQCEAKGGKIHTTYTTTYGYHNGQYGQYQSSTTECMRPDGTIIP